MPCHDLAGVASIAQLLAPQLRAGDVLLLDGALAAGKTTFTTQLCAALGVTEPVTSPTYAISHLYEARDFDIYHIDAYRLEDETEFYALGIEEFFDAAVAIIEWGSRIKPAFPAHLQLTITAHDEGRGYEFSAQGERWDGVLDALSAA